MTGSESTPQSGATDVEGADATADGVPADEAGVSLQTILGFLAEQPDIPSLLSRYPQLSLEDLKSRFAIAGKADPSPATVRRRKGAHQTEMVKTHGLPEPDGTMHKGAVFRSIVGPLTPGKMLDLGAGKGNFSLSAAQMGWQVTAVDARTTRWPDPETETDAGVAEQIRSITWVQSDIREFPIQRGEYDLICILGLLHHLEVPDQLSLLRRCAGSLLLIDTRIAPSNIDRVGNYEGLVIREHGEDREERDLIPTAAWGNAESFRHTEESLVRLVRDAGYASVMQTRPPHRRDYTFYLCLPRVRADGDRAASRKGKRGAGKVRGSGLWSQWTGDPAAEATEQESQ